MRIGLALRVAVAAMLALAASGCFNAFNVLDGNFKPKGRSIAVLAGVPEDANLAVVALVTDELRKQSRYRVMSQAQIAEAVKPYPQLIKGPYRSAYFEVDVDWKLTDKQKLAVLQRSLGVDYLYVMWAPTAVSSGGKGASLHLVAQLFEFPGAREVGQSPNYSQRNKDDASNLKQGAEKVARQLAEKTGMLGKNQ